MPQFKTLIVSSAVALLAFLPWAGVCAQPAASDWETAAAHAKQTFAAGNLAESEQDWRDAVTLAEQSGNIEPGVVTCLVGLSNVYEKRGNPAEAERLYELAMRNLEGLVGPTDPRFADWMPDLAVLYDAHGKPEKAEVLFKRALLLKQRAFGADDVRVAVVMEQYARFLRKNDRLTEATELETKARIIRQKLSG